MKHLLFAATFLLVAACASAQPRPLAGTTLVTTDTSVLSACIGANTINAPSSCLGGLQAGPTVVNQAMTLPNFTPGVTTNKLYNTGGTLFWNGAAVAVGGAVGPGTVNTLPVFTGVNSIGNSLFSQAGTVMTLAGTLQSTVFGANSFTAGGVGLEALIIRNTTAGVGNGAALQLGNDASATLGILQAFSSTFTTGGPNVANGLILVSTGVGGLSLQASNAAGQIRFYTGGATERGQVTAAGLWNWSTFGAHVFTGGGVGANQLSVTNTTAGAGNFGRILAGSDTVSTVVDANSSTFTTSGIQVQAGSTLAGTGSGGLSLAATNAAGDVRIYSGGSTLRARFAANGDYNLGANLTDSVATPTINSADGVCGLGTALSGRPYAMTLTVAGVPNACVVTFNSTFANPPVCIAAVVDTPLGLIRISSLTTTTATLELVGTTGQVVKMFCRGY